MTSYMFVNVKQVDVEIRETFVALIKIIVYLI